jgi:integrase/recombinase XerD
MKTTPKEESRTGTGEGALNAYLDHLRLERRLSAQTVLSYRSDLTQHLAFLDSVERVALAAVETEILRRDLARLHEEGRARRSQQRYRSSLRGFYRFLTQEGWIARDPSGDLEGPRVTRRLPESLTIEEMERLILAASGSEPLDLRDRAMIEIAYGGGLRVSELVGLGAEGVDVENRCAHVHGKGDRERIVPLGRPAIAATRRYLRRGRPELIRNRRSDRLFVNQRGGPLTRMGFFRVLRRRAIAAGLDPRRIHPHLLRHTFATHLLQNGVSLRVVQELLGHRSLTTTEIYTAVDATYLRQIHRKHHPRGSAAKGAIA